MNSCNHILQRKYPERLLKVLYARSSPQISSIVLSIKKKVETENYFEVLSFCKAFPHKDISCIVSETKYLIIETVMEPQSLSWKKEKKGELQM